MGIKPAVSPGRPRCPGFLFFGLSNSCRFRFCYKSYSPPSLETLLPVASQAVLGVFREQIARSIDAELGDQLAAIGNHEGRQ